MTTYGMVFNRKNCIACNACTMACKMNNATPKGVFRTKVVPEESGAYPHAAIVITPHVCMHCKNATCVQVCPTGATRKQENGIVSIDKERCIGCQFCVIACLYHARTLAKTLDSAFEGHDITPYESAHIGHQKAGTVDKCDFCAGRLGEGKLPACVAACPTQSRIFGDLDDPTSDIVSYIGSHQAYRMHEELGFEPQFYFCDK